MRLTDNSSNDSWVLTYHPKEGYRIEPNVIHSIDSGAFEVGTGVKNIHIKEKPMQFSSFDLIFFVLLAFLLGTLLGSFLGYKSGIKQVRASAINEKLGEYDIDTDTGKIEFWWTGKPNE